MRTRSLWQYAKFVLLVTVVTCGGTVTAHATTATSPSYQMTESEFGSINNQDSCSGEYCARMSIGSVNSGSGGSAKYSAKFGPITDDEPSLEVIVEPGVSDLGELTTSKTAFKTMMVKVRSYLSDGYTLQISGTPPSIKGHTLATPSVPTVSKPGTEQFGINATINTAPEVGAAPVQMPSSDFSYGAVEQGYATANMFKYSSQDVVAKSLSESGRTDYTISMIINVSNATPAGHYDSEFAAVVIPVF
ncbi:MAG: hypothetical protein ABIR91_04840 [Candidatus Saccharimonadales bacterium]